VPSRPSLRVSQLQLYRVGTRVASFVPRRVGGSVAAAAAVLGSVALPAKRRVVQRHQERLARPEVLSPVELRRRTRRVFATYGRYWFDVLQLTHLSGEQVDANIEVDGEEHLAAAIAAGRGAVLVMPHIGNWDIGGAWLGRHYPLTVVAERLEPPEVFDWFVNMRERNGMRVVGLDGDTAAALSRDIREGRALGLLCDRDLHGDGLEVVFFGETTTLPAGPATLALRHNAPVLPVTVYQTPAGPARGYIGPPIPFERTGKFRVDATALTQLIAHALEDMIRKAPEQWHVLAPNWPSDRPADRPS
jgi:phosphatidylinositol dimannoside acyltransferase